MRGGARAKNASTDSSVAGDTGSNEIGSDGGPASAAERGQASGTPRPRRSRVNAASDAASPWYSRKGLFRPSFARAGPTSTEWATARPFILAFLGDPVVNLFQWQNRAELMRLSNALIHDDGRRWHDFAAAANAVGFVANVLARHGAEVAANQALRKAVGILLEFGVNVDAKADDHFQAAVDAAAAAGQPLNKEYFEKWKGRPTPDDFRAFAAAHPDFRATPAHASTFWTRCCPTPAVFPRRRRRSSTLTLRSSEATLPTCPRHRSWRTASRSCR